MTRLTRLSLANVRNIAAAELAPSPRMNVLHGRNGSGKTSVLEAIHILGLGRSFRTRQAAKVIRYGESALTVTGRLDGPPGQGGHLGVRKGRDTTRIRRDGETLASAAELAACLPLLAITPDCQQIVFGGPRHRRQRLDWALFHVEPDYHVAWMRYRDALKQRTALLRHGASGDAFAPWHAEMAASAGVLHARRAAYVEALMPILEETVAALLGTRVELAYRPGWSPEADLARLLDQGVARDRETGRTHLGPHRADLGIRERGAAFRDVSSRGQAKLFVAALLLSQARLLAIQRGRAPVILVDDLPAELDPGSRARFLDGLRLPGAQVFLTTTSRGLIAEHAWSDCRWFHVEQGRISRSPADLPEVV